MIIAEEKFAPFKKNDGEDPLKNVYARINLDRSTDLDDFFRCTAQQKTPLLFKDATSSHPSRFSPTLFDDVVKQHVACAKTLSAQGFSMVAIAADDDGLLQHVLSPRFGTLTEEERRAPLLTLYSELAQIMEHVTVVLCVEELAPQGMDATDGIAIARELERLGLKDIIATSGTKDFMPLYRRRMTQKKQEENPNFSSHEPALASALWLKEHTNLSVSCLTFVDDKATACALAQSLGLAGLIEKAQIDDI